MTLVAPPIELDAYPEVRSATSERALALGYRNTRPALRRERCAVCGLFIEAPAEDWDAIAAAVRSHNASTAHRQAAQAEGSD